MKPIRSATTQPKHFLKVDSVLLGATVPSPAQSRAPQVMCASPALMRHVDQPWMRAELARQAGLALDVTERLTETATIPLDVTARHTLEVGSSGSGKSRLAESLITQHLQAGHSVVMLEPTTQALRRIMRQAQALGMPPEQVTILSPRLAAVPGFNPLRTDLPLAQAAGDLVAMLERSTAGGGPRMADVLMNALLVIGAHRLSLYELARFLQSEEYRTQLLRLSPPGENSLAFDEARTYFQEEFAGWSKSERTQAIAPVLRRFRELLRNDFLRTLLCAKRQTLDLASLWQQPGLILVHLDRTSLGEDGTRLLGGLIAQLLLRTAPRAKGPIPVLLVLDELATVEHFIGSTIADIVTTARQHGLRLLMACQHLTQLSPALQAALLSNTALQAFFRLGPADVRLVAQTLAVGMPVRLARLSVEAPPPDRTTGLTAQTLWRHVVQDAWGRPLRLSPVVWERLMRQDLIAPALGQSTALQLLRRLVPEAGRLYVEAPDSGRAVEIGQYVRALKPMEFWLDGPAPLTLVVAFPKVQVSGIQRLTATDAAQTWARTLQELPVQHAAIRVEGKAMGVVKVATVPDLAPTKGDRAFIAAVTAHSQSAAEVAATIAWRQERIAQMIQGIPPANSTHPNTTHPNTTHSTRSGLDKQYKENISWHPHLTTR